MTLKLIIARHAKSDWHAGSITDHMRPLNGRGLRQASQLGEELLKNTHRPSIIVSSDARRTEETALLMEPLFPNVHIQYDHRLYLGEFSDIQHSVLTHAKHHKNVLVLGHNPGFSVAASLLCRKSVELKTACAAVLETTQTDWESAFIAKNFELIEVVEGRDSPQEPC